MPAVQSKINVDGKSPADEDIAKARGHSKTKNKDRNNNRKTETTWDRLSRKKNVVPDLDLKSLSPRTNNKKNHSKDESPRKTRNDSSTRTAAAKLAKKRQWDVGNAYSKLNLQALQNHATKPLSQRSTFLDEIRTSRSLFYLSPRQEPPNSLADVENINPNQIPDNFFECNELDDFFRTQFPDFENSSEYDYQTANLLEDFDLPSVGSVTSCNINNSPGVLRHFKELLHQEENSRTNLLGKSEIALLKDIVKADERHQKLQRDDYDLLKEILTGQLKEITQQERVIKIALKKIRCQKEDEVEVTTLKVDTAEQPMEDTLRTPKKVKSALPEGISLIKDTSARSQNLKTPRQEVDIIFKNVPSLEKEIRILRSLGLKLEETLKKSERKHLEQKVQPPLILHPLQLRYFKHCIGHVSYIVRPIAFQVITDFAQEFQIRHQTLNELKLEREFFIPTDFDSFTLQKTNFHKLSRNPELLLRRLKPFTKGPGMKFNIIEQDPMFFNHFLAKMCKICSDPVEGHETYIPKKNDILKPNSNPNPKIIFVKSGAGDHSDFPPIKDENLPRLEPPNVKEKPLRKKKKKLSSTPMPEEKLVTPKNGLFRTVLLGTLQLSILFTVVTAILYPDLICL